MPTPLHLVAASLVASLVPLLAAQDAPPRGHSHFGKPFDEGPRQAAWHMPGTGDVSFPVTTRSAEAQRFFDQAIGQLHGFWYFEAERSFRQVAALDADCAMSYWGMAMANVENWTRAAGFIQAAVKRKAGATRKEMAWIDALAAFYEGKEEPKKAEATSRHRALERAIEAIVREFPDDIEAKALLANQIWLNNDKGLPLNAHLPVDLMLDAVFDRSPMHPAHHYRIHLWDDEKPENALLSAARCGQSAPGIAHMWHMSGHIFAGLDRHADAAWQQEASARVDHAQMLHDRVMPYHSDNYGHNNEWLARSFMHVGRVRDALALARNMVELPRHPKHNAADKARTIASYGRARILDITSSYELWDELLALSESVIPPGTPPRVDAARHHMLLGRAFLERGDVQRHAKEAAAIEQLLVEERADRAKGIDKAESEAKAARSPDDRVTAAMTKAIEDHRPTLARIESMATRLTGYRLLGEGKKDEALAEFRKAADLGDDEWAAILLRAGDALDALERSDKAISRNRGRVPSLARHVLILEAAGLRDAAAASMQRLRALAGRADLEVPPLARLSPIARELGLPHDWRQPEEPATDVGVRPALDALGPLHWRPWSAPDFSLSAPDGRRVTRAEFTGRPLLVLFHLGTGCPQCVAQLERFGPATASFAKAGIQIVAIGTDAPPKEANGGPSADTKDFPFPLLADPELTAFREWRAYDDFEKMPLHGAFLVDGNGLVRWQDVSFEPFTDVEFLLAEASRLLALSPESDPKGRR